LALDIAGAFDFSGAVDFLKLVLFAFKKTKKVKKFATQGTVLAYLLFLKVFTSICVCIFLSFLQ
jgi:predicted membrane-bound dolichyl-phosphate-mannose-protein mannosyltransferase